MADLEASGKELEAFFKRAAGKLRSSGNPDPETAKLQPILDAGKKMYKWIDAINSALPPGQKFTLSTAETQRAYPIDHPMSYNVALIEKMMNDFESQAPASMKDVILSSAPVTESFPIPSDQFRTAGLLLDKAYGFSQRWLLLLPEIADYREAKIDDVRGYYVLSGEADLDKKLKGFGQLPKADRDRLSAALVGICLNAGVSKRLCGLELGVAKVRNKVPAFYAEYVAAGKSAWDEFFDIPSDVARKDVSWTFSSPYVMTVPFLDPQDAVVLAYLTGNIEDEWKSLPWQLKLQFVATGDPDQTIHIKEVPGSLPHVNALGGSEITMDGNAPLSEYNVRWTIRHEYGHTLGLPDCYIEFWDDESDSFVSYQLDITNLMCSRRGHFKPVHFEELKKTYLKLP
jgi:hypothetical protein